MLLKRCKNTCNVCSRGLAQEDVLTVTRKSKRGTGAWNQTWTMQSLHGCPFSGTKAVRNKKTLAESLKQVTGWRAGYDIRPLVPQSLAY